MTTWPPTTHQHVQDAIAQQRQSLFDPMDYGAIGDGTPHPLSTRYGTLAAAQAVYPKATALTQEIDGAAIQKASDAATASGFGGLIPITRIYTFNQQITFLKLVNVRGNGSGDATSNSSAFKATGAGAQLQWGDGTTANVRGGFSGGFVVDGQLIGGTSSGGLWLENRVTQRSFGDITIIDSAGDGKVCWYGQNCLYWNFDVQRSAGNNRVWDFGTGGHLMIRCESSACGGYHDYYGNSAGGPYTVPTQITHINGLNERGFNSTSMTNGMVYSADSDRICYVNHIFACGSDAVASGDAMVQVISGDLVLRDCTLSSNGGAKAIRQEGGRITWEGRTLLKNLGTVWQRNGGSANLLGVEQNFGTVTTRWAGTTGQTGAVQVSTTTL
jgi:hypothetical protein